MAMRSVLSPQGYAHYFIWKETLVQNILIYSGLFEYVS